MAKIAQFKFDSSDKASGNVLADYAPVVKIGIQAPVGTVFTLNDGSNISMGRYGIYELDLQGLGYLNSLTFPRGLELSQGEYVLVDIVYEGSGA